MNYSEDLINTYRKKIYELLKDYEGEPVVIEGVPSNLLKQILFDKDPYNRGLFFASEIFEIAEKIDFRNVIFDNFVFKMMRLSKLKNLMINPDNIIIPKNIFANFSGVYFTKEIAISKLFYVSFEGSFNAELNIVKSPDDSIRLEQVNFCDATFKNPIATSAAIYSCNFEGSHGAIIDLGKVDIWNAILYDATIYGNFDPFQHYDIVPSIEEIKRVYGDLTEPTLIRRKDFN